ncbi:hypothetical protein COW36_02045 [bacterium (Candidatus Blackallbacteria) CG17_big_fil_post_rev_8_21_14_2_50_48_46]|uniref:SGNH hydrolase-type esterase domain-containing protein n=1 Tax=bacterium (Candidatus Blackallbacteria) CG17_big_fil_post_rev_8_21_14_2_50_48_46 TaxID=2014261 RepID=A0A2M7GAM9_9BACT|nr:MAG: hypothetical protein COW64_26435 [bacterium (Candidatus Blackallbacteria) CG18_big_fil_WC_8_21_14_2_50_49_26]PIW19216.1 MAG: hypothetical protein COW36_02045 [bacterium (Candidatus Blackallbacteria) CG17_big_fil_post_rev_8_21_14_2_50_48_46]PIW45434.1 MAG: hypothetical protein COW20_20095 [bacterium (Candidatus Blackallbacteria) CG13_big_fil_rev_8_21_14_2_50_49_14]
MPQIPPQNGQLPSLLRAAGLKPPSSLFKAEFPQIQLPPPEDHFQTPEASSAKASPSLDLFSSGRPLIGPGTKVLHIGDSHTVGIYGQEMDKLLRATGAQVSTYGSAGSSPSWWLKGTSTHSGFFSRDDQGKVDAPKDWRAPHPTPKLPDLLKKHQPTVIMISLGANLIGANAATIESQVKELAEIAKASGAQIIWVGPPDGRESKKPNSKQTNLYNHLKAAASQYGAFIDSRPLTEYPEKGGDGLHYWGTEGSKIAKSWTHEVFEQIQALPPQAN